MPEAKVHSCYNGTLNLKNDYCGTFDMLFAARGKDGVIRPFLADYKTNASLTNNYNRNLNKTLLEPFDYMINEPFSLYTLQLSAYSLCLEQLGYKMTHRVIIWLKEDGTYDKIPVEDVTQKLREIL